MLQLAEIMPALNAVRALLGDPANFPGSPA
jgi:hypothetical protein